MCKKRNRLIDDVDLNEGCQIFLYTKHQKGGKYNKLPLNYEMATNYTKWPFKIPNGQTKKNVSHSMALKNLHKLGILVWKYM
jgi:hypothetical protein